MLTLMTIVALLTPQGTELPGWVEIGPERGHVMEAAIGPEQVSVATRVGVMTADAALSTWARDPRFPPDTFALAYGPSGTGWASAGGALWRVVDTARIAAQLPPNSHAVALETTGSGALLAAVRGNATAVWRVDDAGGAPVLDNVDPWCLVARGSSVWVGTLGDGVWVSEDDGRTFRQVVAEGEITGLGRVGDAIWFGDRDGRVVALPGEREVARLDSGWVLGIAETRDGALLMAELPGGQQALYRHAAGALTALGDRAVDEDPGRTNFTGVWPLADGSAMVGTFRRGPLVWDGEALTPRRAGFRATVVRGAVQGHDQFMLALMGTGVYGSTDGWRTLIPHHHPGQGPVTDTVSLAVVDEGIVAVDFDGVKLLDAASGQWRMLFRGVDEPGAGRPNALASVGVDADGRWWGITEKGNIWQREDDAWRACRATGGVRLEGRGEHLLLMTQQAGYQRLVGCDAEPEAVHGDAVQPGAPDSSRSSDGWVAAPGGLWRDGRRVADLGGRPVSALAVRGDEALVVSGDEVLGCQGGSCAPVARELTQRVAGIGWLPDGRVWVAEARGTLLAAGGGRSVEAWSDIELPRGSSRPPYDLFRVPWSDEGRYSGGAGPQGGPNGPGDPGPGPGGPRDGDPGPGPHDGGPRDGGGPGPGPGDAGAGGGTPAEDEEAAAGPAWLRITSVVVIGLGAAALMVYMRRRY